MKDLYQDITNRIIAQLEEGTAPWVKPWASSVRPAMPHNHSSGRPYSGINALVLWCESLAQGYASPAWLTYKQAKDMGGHVRKGEHGTTVVFWKFLEKPSGEIDADGADVIDRIPMARAYTVFNVQQCEDLEGAPEPVTAPPGHESAPARRRRPARHWTATFFKDGKPDPEIVALFGTHIIPTAYTGLASAATVLRGIQRRNPAAKVSLI